MFIILNSWNGKTFENDNICHVCNNRATTANLGCSLIRTQIISICKGCLLNIVKEIDKKVLESKTF